MLSKELGVLLVLANHPATWCPTHSKVLLLVLRNCWVRTEDASFQGHRLTACTFPTQHHTVLRRRHEVCNPLVSKHRTGGGCHGGGRLVPVLLAESRANVDGKCFTVLGRRPPHHLHGLLSMVGSFTDNYRCPSPLRCDNNHCLHLADIVCHRLLLVLGRGLGHIVSLAAMAVDEPVLLRVSCQLLSCACSLAGNLELLNDGQGPW